MTKPIQADELLDLYSGDDEEPVDFETRRVIAKDPGTDASILVKLAHDPSPWIKALVRENPSTPEEVAKSITDAAPLYAIVSKYCTDSWFWSSGDWKDYVCYDFDNNVVVVKNRDTSGIEEAFWWEDAKSITSAIDNSYGEKDRYLDECPSDVSEDKLVYIWDEYSESDIEDVDVIAGIAEVLYPDLHLETGTIRGSCQGDWAEVVYVKDTVDVSTLEDWYFGNIYDVDVFEIDIAALDDEDMTADDLDVNNISDYGDSTDFGSTPMTSTEVWKLSDEELIERIANDNGINPKDCIYLEE